MYFGIKIRVAKLYSAWLTGMRVHAWNDDNDYVDRIPALIGTCNQSKAEISGRYSRGFSTYFEMKYFSHWTRRQNLWNNRGAIIPLFKTANSISSDDHSTIQY